MALKPDRDYGLDTNISHYFVAGTVTIANTDAGRIASLETSTSGVGMDSNAGSGFTQGQGFGNVGTVEFATLASGAVPVGVTLQSVENHQSQEPARRNFNKNVTYPSMKIALARRGWLVTNRINGTPTAGDVAYVGPSGLISTTGGVDGDGIAVIGRFETTEDSDGFARVHLNF